MVVEGRDVVVGEREKKRKEKKDIPWRIHMSPSRVGSNMARFT
jgi:hypothetical protein